MLRHFCSVGSTGHASQHGRELTVGRGRGVSSSASTGLLGNALLQPLEQQPPADFFGAETSLKLVHFVLQSLNTHTQCLFCHLFRHEQGEELEQGEGLQEKQNEGFYGCTSRRPSADGRQRGDKPDDETIRPLTQCVHVWVFVRVCVCMCECVNTAQRQSTSTVMSRMR